ncbi:histidine phosphatase family protein [Secundilactobacillus folii]|uniref:Histidine phosphatase family protein n=1 Tax=Secundilactobacillus folii TaxID=2678357 RepID=A0A7X2XUX2_9LACO|nr:histidine phosphatase family protein [Secundilactobacillus folii]MTV82084.1 histidine phosphatase family protein [Secundilactobacillus folii]
MKKLNLYVVRHGQTYFNIYNKLQGWSNSPLTQKGLDGAVATGQRLADVHFERAYCSDTTRAMDTAKLILAENKQHSPKEAITVMNFREEFYGYFEGNDMGQAWYLAGAPHGLPTFKDIVNKYSIGKAKDYLKEADPFHQAENNEEYWQRVDQGFQIILQDSALQDGDNVLLISHGNTLLSLMERYGGGQYDLTVRPKNGSLTRLTLSEDGGIDVVSYNQ